MTESSPPAPLPRRTGEEPSPARGEGLPASGARPPIDWAAVHQRLARLAAAVERGWAPEAGERRRILEARARALARPLAAACPAPALEVVEFRLAGERYGIGCAWVREVLPLAGLTRLPGAPAFVLGIIHLRGEIVSVLDLETLLGLPAPPGSGASGAVPAGTGPAGTVLILDAADMRFGLRADAIAGVTALASGALQPAPPAVGAGGEDYLLGMTAEHLAILDGARLLTDRRLVVRETVDA